MSVADFLDRAGWGGAVPAPLAGDASSRRYTRLERGGDTAILMQDPGGDVDRFARLARLLSGWGLSAPAILACDAAAGLLLAEDLGDALFARLAASEPAREPALYAVAVDVLGVVERHAPPADLPPAGPAELAALTGMAFDWYLPRAGGPRDAGLAADVRTAFEDALATHAPEMSVMILRDYHAENLLWLPDRTGVARAGLLDFQDAMRGPPGYDLVSLVEDARRDVSPAAAEIARTRYLERSGRSAAELRPRLAVLGAQRNLRILGVFARLAAQAGKPHYIDLVPRVWAHLDRALDHPALAAVARRLRPVLPRPTPAMLAAMRTPCPTP
ncbi:aminoglycoside phosphotransferase family protein [Roseivivax isoporae]|uniref:Aminoglycoside phosphotransferase n=1 Tax=Roseivivax isoporae LMG 25204 TaxID=1449351 RepID=X7F4R1_9RHOB|nr:phosphotransferase [Roseivivax isoporae]ETX27912.1 aminoglycoside phosphotransferase [Roseivivax isoporae LMG 25204]